MINFNPNYNYYNQTQYAPKQRQDSISQPQSNPLDRNFSLNPMPFIREHVLNRPVSYNYMGEVSVPYCQNAKLYRLDTGLNVIIIPKKGETIVKTYVNSGSMNEEDTKRGISHFCEHSLFNGTTDPKSAQDPNQEPESYNLKPGEFFQKTSEMGAQTNASTNFAQTDFYVASHLMNKNDLNNIIKMHADMIQNPAFKSDMIEKEKGPVISEISMVSDNPDNIAINRAIKNLFQIKSSSNDLVAGTIQNISKLNRADMLRHYRQNYNPDNLTTVITGEVDPEETIKTVAQYFNVYKAPGEIRKFEELLPINQSKRIDLISQKTNATTIAAAFSGPSNVSTYDKVILDAVTILLTGYDSAHLNKNLEPINASAGFVVEKIGTKPTDPQALIFSTKVSPDNCENALTRIYKTIHQLQNNPVSQEELEMVKKKLHKNLADISENSSYLNELIGSSVLSQDSEYFSKYNEMLQNVTPEQITEFAKKYLDLNKVSITNIHPQSVDNNTLQKNFNDQKNKQISFGSNNLITPAMETEKSIDISKIKEYRLQNNIDLIVNTNKTDFAFYKLNLMNETPLKVKPGTIEVLSEILNSGSKFRDKQTFLEQNDLKCIEYTFSADNGKISAQAECETQDTQIAINGLSEVLLNPRLDKQTFEKAKSKIKELCQRSQKSAMDNTNAFLYPGLIQTPKQIEKVIDNVTLEDCQNAYQQMMNGSKASFIATANTEKYPQINNAVIDAVSKNFPTFKSFNNNLLELYTPIKEKAVIVDSEQRNQAEIAQSYRFKVSGNIKDDAAFYLLNLILGANPSSRLFMDLREQQKLAYRVNSSYSSLGNDGVMSLYILTTTDDPNDIKSRLDNLKTSIEGFDKHIEKLKTEAVSQNELDTAKLLLKQALLSQNETSRHRNATLANDKNSSYSVYRSKSLFDVAEEITPADIQRAANYAFSDKPVISVLASQKTLDAHKDYLASKGKVINA